MLIDGKRNLNIRGHVRGCTLILQGPKYTAAVIKVRFELDFSAFPSEEVNHDISCNVAGQICF